jgi:hypothetical protein
VALLDHLLQAGTYTYAVSAVNAFGEGPTSAYSLRLRSLLLEIKLQLTIGAVAGALYYRVYRTAAKLLLRLLQAFSSSVTLLLLLRRNFYRPW